MKYKKYILIYFEDYYPSGGTYDIRESYDSIEEVETHIVRLGYTPDNVQVINRDTWEDVVTKFTR